MESIHAFMQSVQACNDNGKKKCSLPCDPATENCEDANHEVR